MRDFRNHVIVFLTLTTVATGYLAWYKAHELSLLQNAPATQPNLAESRRAAWAAEISDASTETELRDGVKEKGLSGTSGTTPEPRRRFNESRQATMMKLLDNPEYVRLMTITQKARLDPRFAALFKQLGLPPDELEKFKNLLVERQSALIDLFAAARSQGMDLRQDREMFRELAKNARDEVEVNIRATLGDSAYATFQNYEQTLPYRNLTNQLQARLSYSPSPLTESQNEQLVQIIASTSPSASTGRQPTARSGMAGLGGSQIPAISEETVQQAAGILTPDQHAVLQQMQAEQAAEKQLSDLTRARMNQPNTTAPVKQSDSAK